MSGDDVKKLYSLGSAKWYGSFKRLWNKMISSKAEDELRSFLQNNLDETKTILELGCGTALNLEKIFSLNLKFKKYLGLDFSPDMLKIAQSEFVNTLNIEFQQKDITRLDDINEKYDIIICTWVLSHLQFPSHLVNRTQKLTNKEGRFFLIFFTKPKWYINFWLFPFAKYLFRTNYISNEEIQQFKNVKSKHSHSSNIVTTIEIYE